MRVDLTLTFSLNIDLGGMVVCESGNHTGDEIVFLIAP